MRIRGTSKSVCNLCLYAFFDNDKNSFTCMMKKEETEANNSCKKFKYDIYKYRPLKKKLIGSFRKEDFEI